MDFSIHVDTIGMGLSILYSKGPQVEVPNNGVFGPWKLASLLANSADPDEMPHYAALHQGLHCLPEFSGVLSYSFDSLQAGEL